MLKPSIVAAGLDPDTLQPAGALDASKTLSVEGRDDRPARWRDIWSAGHTVGLVDDVPTVADLVARLRAEYEAT